ncbi:peptidyl-prolyl cis-trans isomerase- PpiC-type [Apiospora kogelbergensis]|uniref:peptidyl-prolyl cis-trans isomerase- PpiC-type n=1 Tax=Apiospora kogelbergensis TaxID=1337665 RepID=UPI00312D4411
MAKGNKSKNDTQAADGKGKGKGGKGGAPEQKAAPVKGAQSAKIRHILGNFPLLQCAKFSKKEEALALLLGKDGEIPKKFTDVAMDFSEDKAKQGGLLPTIVKGLTPYDPTFMEVAFSLPICKVDEVSKYAASLGQVKTENGYHILLREPLK